MKKDLKKERKKNRETKHKHNKPLVIVIVVIVNATLGLHDDRHLLQQHAVVPLHLCQALVFHLLRRRKVRKRKKTIMKREVKFT